MVAAFIADKIHVVFEIKRSGLKVVTTAYCGTNASAADGTLQLPDRAFDGRSSYEGREVCRYCREKACF